MNGRPTVLAGRLVVGTDRSETHGWIELREDRIVAVGSGAPASAPLDLGATVLVPGFVDLQANGVGDRDFAASDVDGWLDALRTLGRAGTTACLPTIVTAPLDEYDAVLRVAREARARAAAERDSPVAQVLGVHLEGPFLGGAPGAHVREYVRPVDLGWLDQLLDRHGDLVRMVTLAPEADPGHEAIRMLRRHGIVVALGHSTATYDDAVLAAAAGARVVTHAFNGMAPLHHRAPGLVGAALTVPDLTPTVIVDFVHVHPAVVDLVVRVRPDAVLVSDAVAVGAGAVGSGRVGPLDVRDAGDVARLADGTLAGSTITLVEAVRNVVTTGASVAHAVAMASGHPAGIVGDPERGRLAPGARADVVALSADRLDVIAVWIGGRRVGE